MRRGELGKKPVDASQKDAGRNGHGDIRGRWALITGASSGIGVEIARELASRGVNLVLAARRRAPMEELAAELARGGTQVIVEPCDLSRAGEPERLVGVLGKRGISVSILVNNAGFGAYGTFDSIDAATEESMVDLNVKAVARLTRLLVGPMRADGFGRILLTASTGAYQPSPLYATYSATKAFVLSYGHAIRRELRGTGVTVTVLSPGVTQTEFHRISGLETNAFKRATMMEAAPVARHAVRALLRGRAEVVTGALNKIMAFSARLMPRTLAAGIAARAMR
jgi:short-subunit dehydrogenase